MFRKEIAVSIPHWLLPLLILPVLVGSIARASEDRLEIVATTTQAADLVHILAQGIDGIRITSDGPGATPFVFADRIRQSHESSRR